MTCLFLASLQLFQASSANEWKTISVRDRLAENDEEVLVKCSTWTADGKRIICAARNAVLVGIFQNVERKRMTVPQGLLSSSCFFEHPYVQID